MKIEKMLGQNRRDFTAIYVCEHCGAKKEGYGYDDTNFHINVIPKMKCNKCGKTSGKDYKAQNTRYPDEYVI